MDHTARDDDFYMTVLETAAALPAADRERYLRAACPETSLAADIMERIGWRDRMGDFLMEPLLPRLPAVLPFEPGEIVNGRFRILREVGQGAMGVVFEAVDEKLGERRAIKCAKPGFSASLPPEARTALRVAHPNVCRLFEIHTVETPAAPVDFLSMEYIEGSTLAVHLKQAGPLEVGHALRLGREIASGLAEAHRRNILHRDLKPGNVMIAAQGQRAVITDFGLAQEPGPAASSDLRGAPDYVAPERWLGKPAVAASDVYSLGVILYELLTGRRPFPPGTPIETRLHGKPAPPSQVRPDLPRWLDALVLRCLDPDQAKRFPDGAAVADVLTGQTPRGWIVWAAAAAVAVLLTMFLLWPRVWPPSGVPRLAILPAVSEDAQAAVTANALLEDLSTRLTHLRFREGRILTLPSTEAERSNVRTGEDAVRRLGATHALSTEVRREQGRLHLRTSIQDLRTGLRLREFSHAYADAELAAAPQALAGFTLGALNVTADQPADVIAPAAYLPYVEGLSLLSRGRMLHGDGFDAALVRFEQAMRMDPQSVLVRAAHVEALLAKYFTTNEKRWQRQARDEAGELARLHPDSMATLLLGGRLWRDVGDYEESAAQFERAIRIERDNPHAWSGLARTLAETRSRRQEAAATFKKAIELQPGHYYSYYELAVFHQRQGNYDMAEAFFRESIARAPNAVLPHSGLGGLLMDRGRYPEGERELRASLEVAETPMALNNLAAGLAYQHRDAEAVPLYERARALGAENFIHNMNIGDSLRRIGRAGDARLAYQRCFDLAREEMLQKPADAYTRAFFGYCAARLGQRSLAEDNITQALHFSRQNVKVIRRAVITYEALGFRDRALDLLHNAPKDLLSELSRQPDLAELRRDPRFPPQQ